MDLSYTSFQLYRPACVRAVAASSPPSTLLFYLHYWLSVGKDLHCEVMYRAVGLSAGWRAVVIYTSPYTTANLQ